MATATPTAAELYETYQREVAAPRAAAEKAAEEKASTTAANAEATPAEAAKRALTVSSALMRVHTCSNFDCDIMRLRPWLPAKVYPQHTPIGQKKDSKVPLPLVLRGSASWRSVKKYGFTFGAEVSVSIWT